MVEGSEKTKEEKYLRGNKKDYTITKAFLNRGCVVALEGAFSYDVSSSLVHGEQEEN